MWAAGCILAEMLTGRMLFAGTPTVSLTLAAKHSIHDLAVPLEHYDATD